MCRPLSAVLVCIFFASSAWSDTCSVEQENALTYQGRLEFEGEPVNDQCLMAFGLWTDPTSIVPEDLLTTQSHSTVDFVDGLFAVEVSFDPALMTEGPRWVEIFVDCGENSQTLSPRQKLTGTPYSLRTRGLHVDAANNVGIGTSCPSERLEVAGNVVVDGTVRSGTMIIDGATESIRTDTQFEAVVGAGGSTLRISQVEAVIGSGAGFLRITPAGQTVNVAAGYNGNTIASGVTGGTIGGGGQALSVNAVYDQFGTVSGGMKNTTGINDGQPASSMAQTVGGGFDNSATGHFSTIGGGQLNTAAGYWSVVPGGNSNSAAGAKSFAAGSRAKANHNGAFVWGDTTNADFASTGADQFLIRAANGVGIGTNAPTNQLSVAGSADISDRLGIGTNAPTNKLSVAGRVDISDRLGIGTTLLEGRLHVAGGPTWTTSGWNKSITLDNRGAIELGQDSATKFGIGATGDRLYFWTTSGNGTSTATNYFMHAGEDDLTIASKVVTITGNVGIGTITPQTKLDVAGRIRSTEVEITGGSDIAEPYDIGPFAGTNPKPGMVVTIDPNRIGKMLVSAKAYDRTVAGVISGAGGVKPGLTLRQEGSIADGDLPVASVGRVWCWCDADANGPIQPGDLLTASNTPGHAMKVSDFQRSQGAVLGKAMSSLETGRGLVLLLVALQ